MPLYFAYGSNMLPAQMAERCPGARAVGPGRLPGWRFMFNTRGSAAILRDPDAAVHGVLWRVDTAHVTRLDRYEGVRWGNYHRRVLRVEAAWADELPAVTYVGTRQYHGRPRINYMLTAVLPGAEAFDLPEHYLAELQAWLPDRPIGDRRTRYRGRRRAVRFPR